MRGFFFASLFVCGLLGAFVSVLHGFAEMRFMGLLTPLIWQRVVRFDTILVNGDIDEIYSYSDIILRRSLSERKLTVVPQNAPNQLISLRCPCFSNVSIFLASRGLDCAIALGSIFAPFWIMLMR